MFLIGTQSTERIDRQRVSADHALDRRRLGFGIGRIGSVISPAIAGVLLAMQWQPAQLFMIAAIPTVLASIGVFVLTPVHQSARSNRVEV